MVSSTNQRHHGLAVLEINGVKYAIAQSSVMAVIAAKYATNDLELLESQGAAYFLASDKHELKLGAFHPDTQTEILKVVNNLHIGELLFYRILQ
ncbi:MAG: hypothetical protein WBB28_24840 [Crinalium sp.]